MDGRHASRQQGRPLTSAAGRPSAFLWRSQLNAGTLASAKRLMTDADQVWNRASLDAGGPNPREGDRALAGLLLAHGLVMNGGVRHACSSLDPQELRAAASGYRFFGFEDIPALLERSALSDQSELDKDVDDDGDPLDQEYWDIIPNDETIVERFHAMYTASPDRFSPT